MCRFRHLSLLLLLIFGTPACSRRAAIDEAPELEVVMEPYPIPAIIGPSLLTIRINDEAGNPAGDFTIDVRGDMSHAGMTPVIVTGTAGEDGIFSVPFEWTMAGDWVITITAMLPDGRMLLRSLPLRVEP